MDAAFATGKYPAYTTAELKQFVAEYDPAKALDQNRAPSIIAAMKAEIARRAAVEAGDVSQMTAGERLRAVRAEDPIANERCAYRLNTLVCLARNGHPGKMSREETEIANMCSDLKRPITNCASLIMRLRLKAA